MADAIDRLELVRKGYEAWNGGDREWVLNHMTEDVEWVSPPEDPDPGTFTGHQGVERFWGQWRAAVGQLHFEPLELIETDDHIVVTAVRSGKGEHSGLEISDRLVQVFSFEGDRCSRVAEFYDRDDALRFAGLDPAVTPESRSVTQADFGRG